MHKQLKWKRPLSIAGLVVAVFGTVYFFQLANEAIWLRYFYVSVCLVVVMSTIVHSFRKRDALLAATQGAERNVLVARMKFRAEVMAAFALIVFIGPYYQIGLSLDKLARQEQLRHLTAASAIFRESLSHEYCLSRQLLKKSCDAVDQKIASLYENVILGTGEKVAENIDEIIFSIKLLDLPAGSAKAEALNQGVSRLKVIDLRDGLLTYAFSLLPLLILLFASLAVSSKVAVAWAESRVRLGEQLMEMKKAKDEAKNEERRQKLEEEARRREQASS